MARNSEPDTAKKRAKVLELDLESTTPLSFGKAMQTPKADDEDHDTHERRCWPEKMHVTSNGIVLIPPMMMKKCITSAAAYMSESVPGKGMAKFTKHFLSGLLIADPIEIGVKAKDVKSERLFVAADGKTGSGKRVWRHFPLIVSWRATVRIHLLDPTLQIHWQKVVQYAEYAGDFIGVGRFAPRRGGYYGRFKVTAHRVIE